MSQVRALLLLAGAALLLFMSSASADGAFASRFTGIVKLDDTDVAGGTLVTAIIGGVEYNTHTPAADSSSTYSLTIQPPEGKSYPNGTKVAFKIKGYAADETATFEAGTDQLLDLTASTGSMSAPPSSTATAAPLNVWVIIAPILAILVAGSLTYYLVLLNRVISKRAAGKR